MMSKHFSAGIVLIPGSACDHGFPCTWDDIKAEVNGIFTSFGIPTLSPDVLINNVTWTSTEPLEGYIHHDAKNVDVITKTMINAQHIANHFRITDPDGNFMKKYATYDDTFDELWNAKMQVLTDEPAGIEYGFQMPLQYTRIDRQSDVQGAKQALKEVLQGCLPTQFVINDVHGNDITKAAQDDIERNGYISALDQNQFPVTFKLKPSEQSNSAVSKAVPVSYTHLRAHET